jgi:ParB-like chromosome segregation protein Spo0J
VSALVADAATLDIVADKLRTTLQQMNISFVEAELDGRLQRRREAVRIAHPIAVVLASSRDHLRRAGRIISVPRPLAGLPDGQAQRSIATAESEGKASALGLRPDLQQILARASPALIELAKRARDVELTERELFVRVPGSTKLSTADEIADMPLAKPSASSMADTIRARRVA